MTSAFEVGAFQHSTQRLAWGYYPLKPPPVGREGVGKEPILAEPLFPETDGKPVRNARVGGTSSVSLRQHPNLAISTLHWFYIITTLLMWRRGHDGVALWPRQGGAVAARIIS